MTIPDCNICVGAKLTSLADAVTHFNGSPLGHRSHRVCVQRRMEENSPSKKLAKKYSVKVPQVKLTKGAWSLRKSLPWSRSFQEGDDVSGPVNFPPFHFYVLHCTHKWEVWPNCRQLWKIVRVRVNSHCSIQDSRAATWGDTLLDLSKCASWRDVRILSSDVQTVEWGTRLTTC